MVKPALVVEDDPYFGKLVCDMLSKRNYPSIQCNSVKDALKHCESVDLVLTDIFMPETDGIEGIPAYRKKNKDIKIIAMSGGLNGQGTDKMLELARKVGANWALKKPFTKDELNEAIAAVMSDHSVNAPATISTSLQKLDIVVIDDDPFMRQAIGTLVSKINGKSPSFFERAKPFLSLLETEAHPDLILLDLNMPDIDGPTVLRLLAHAEFQGNVCLVSGEEQQIMKSVKTLASSHGIQVVGVLSKPVTLEAMSDVISEIIKGRTAPASSKGSIISESDLLRAIQDGKVECHYQPKISTKDLSLVGVEVLARWKHPRLGLLYPDSFIPFAEQNDLIDVITDAVVQKSFKDLAYMRENKGIDIKLSINISTYSLNQLDLPDRLDEFAKKYGIPRNNIIIEITETGIPEDKSKSLEVLTRFRLAGFALSLDDYGTGFSSLSRLEEIPFNELKIDRSFISGCVNDKEKQVIIESSVGMARKLGLSVVAEGAETREDVEFICKAGVDLVQGYYYAKPMPSGELLIWAEQWNAKHKK